MQSIVFESHHVISGDRVSASLHAFLRSRQSIRRFLQEPISEAVLDRVLETATWAPSAHNRQPWRFLIVTEPTRKMTVACAMGNRLRAARLADGDESGAVDADVERSKARILEAPVCIFVFMSLEDMDKYPDAKRRAAEHSMAVQSTAMAAQNLLLGAHAEGLGACVMCAPLFCPDVVSDALGVPDTWQAQMLLVLGKPAAIRERKGRRPLSSVVGGCS
ncbi:MAG: nitroreductase family protein [Burkholderiaceae bacterium]|nr:nitroreductase family protein [Burkholderiaceae bacterium]